jgi:predicted RND superfamily exporter protein
MIRHRWFCFGAALLVLAVLLPASQRLHFDRSLEKMFPAQDPERLTFERVERRFSVSQFMVFAYRDPNLWASDGSGLERNLQWREKIESIDGVRYALDLSRIDQMLSMLKGPTSFFGPTTSAAKSKVDGATRPLLDERNAMAMEYRRMFAGQTHAKDTDLVAIGVLLDQEKQQDPGNNAVLESLRSLSNSAPGGLLVGHLAMVDEGFREIERDGNRLALFSTLCLSLLMLVGFRSLRWALIVVLVVQWSLIVTRGLLVILGWELTMVSSMLSSIVMVVGVATTLHWMVGYQSEYQARDMLVGSQRATEALEASLKKLWWPMFWAVVTDAIGFGSLALSRVGPIQDYGCMMALACAVALVGIFCLVPTLALIPISGFALGRLPGEKYLQGLLQRVLNWATRRSVGVIAIAAMLLAISLIGSMRLQVETDFLKNFQANSPIALAYRTVETELGGAGVWDVAIRAPKPITEEYLQQVLDMEEELLAIEVPSKNTNGETLRLTSALSLADTDRVGKTSPLLRLVPIEARWLGMRQAMGSFFDTLLSESSADATDIKHANDQANAYDFDEGRWLRVMLRSKERSDSEQKTELIARVREVVERYSKLFASEIPGSDPSQSGEVTGYYVLLTRLVEHAVSDQWLAFAIATIGIGVALSVALGSMRFALIGLIPVVIPSFLVLGAMGWLGVRMNLGAAMIAAVSMGLGVDSSLHTLHRYRSERSMGRSVKEALQASQGQTGMAVMMSTIALVIGFGSMAFSAFLPTVAFGTLAAWTMLGGLVGNLVLLPALVWAFNDSTETPTN